MLGLGRLLVIDGGRSRCRVALIGPDGSVESAGEGRGLPAGEGPQALAQAVGEAVAMCEVNPETVDAVSAGLAGLLGMAHQVPELAERLTRLLGAERVVLTGDVVAAYAGALGPLPGVVVAAGTGAVALGLSPDATVRTDGWGHVLGDAGSGYWIGRRGLEEALRAHDGRGGSALLAGLAENHVGPLDELPRRLATGANPVAAVAAFAPRVAEAGHHGDALAAAIWADAGRELAASVAACIRRLFPAGTPVPVSWAGGLFGAGDLLLAPFLGRLAELAPGCIPTVPTGDALTGAATLARAVPDLFRRFVYDSAAAPQPPGDQAAVLT